MNWDNVVAKSYSISGKNIKIHAVSTGAVMVKNKFRDATHSGIRAKLDLIFDQSFTEWMPIWVWIIEHPEGIFVIDTGENTNIVKADYFNNVGLVNKFINQTQFKFKISLNETIDHYIKQHELNSNDATVILTHLHLDHTDGLRYFPTSKIIVNKDEFLHPYSNLPQLYPNNFKPVLITLDESILGFKSMHLTKDKSLNMIYTPGHTYHHSSILLKTDQGIIVFAGDFCYYQDQIKSKIFSGSNIDPKSAKETYHNINNLCKQHKTIILPSHDTDSAKRLLNKEYYNII